MMSATLRALTPEEEQLIKDVLPAVRKTSPKAATVIARLMQAAGASQPNEIATTFVSVREVAQAFEVTDQTIRNWVDRGWLPAERRWGRGPRRIPRSVLASATALSRPRPERKRLTAEQVDALVNRPRKRA
jgi:excisionase family DNA binding protein